MTNPAEIFLSFGGSIDLGHIDNAAATVIGCRPGPVRLQQGFAGPRGFGALHVEGHEPRVKMFRELGYESFLAFCAEIATSYELMQAGEGGRLILVRSRMGRDLRLIVDHRAHEGGFWTVITGMPYRVSRAKVLYSVVQDVSGKGECEPAPSAVGKRSPLRLALSKHLVSDDSAS